MVSSSDHEPELADIINQHQPEQSQDSGLPAWIQAHTPVKAHIAISDDSDDQATGPARDSPGPGPSSAAAAAGADSKPGSSKAAAAAAAKQTPAAAAAASRSGLVPLAGEGNKSQVQLILPEKLLRNKVLIELEPAPHQATELSGDAGAVGRIIAEGNAAEDGCFKIDLKGVLYQATVLPLAGTALVANIGPTDAKVESVMNDFVRLHEESSYHETGMHLEAGAYGLNDLMADDEDNYQLGDEAREGPADKAGAKKAAAKRGSKAGAKTGGSRALKTAGGVKKKKPAAKKATGGGKGSKTPSKSKKAPAAKAAAAAGKANKAKPKASAASKAKRAKPAKKQLSGSEAETEDDKADSDWSMD